MKKSIGELKPDQEVEIYGFIEKIRKQKTVMFIVIRDRTGQIQVVIDKERQKEMFEKTESLLKDSYLRVHGRVVSAEHAKPSGIEILPSQIFVVSSAFDLPITKDSAQSLKQEYRWIDLRQEKNRLIFQIRTFVEHCMREFLIERDFIEIHSPKITGASSEGGAEVFAIDYFSQKAYLAQSPQLYKQMAMAAGFEKVFEIGSFYRAEKSFTPKHTSEMVCLDLEISNIKSYDEIIQVEEELILHVLQKIKQKFGEQIKEVFEVEVELPKTKIPRVKLSEVFEIFERQYGVVVPESKRLDLDSESEKLICDYAKDFLGSDLIFILDYPLEARAFYTKAKSKGSLDSFSFDLLYRGWEMSSGAMREHDVDVLKQQIEDKGIDAEKMKDYLSFFRYGVPTHGGIGFGIDRFIAKLLGLQSLKESIYVFRGPGYLKP